MNNEKNIKIESKVMKFLWNNDFNSSKGRTKVYCYESRDFLGVETCHHCCCHILSKGAYKLLRYHRDNIIPLHPKYHSYLDNESIDKLKKCKRLIQIRKETLKELYTKLKKKPLPKSNRDVLEWLECYTPDEIDEILK